MEHSPTRDKHAQGIAERSVGVIATKTNIAMMASTPNVPPKYWCLATSYACIVIVPGWKRLEREGARSVLFGNGDCS